MDRLMVKSAEESVTAPLPNRPARMLIARRHARLAITSRVFVKIASGRQKPFWVAFTFALGKHLPNGFSAKLRQNGKNLFGWRPLLRWGSTTRLGFRQNHVRTSKTFLGGVHFRVGEASPKWVFGKITLRECRLPAVSFAPLPPPALLNPFSAVALFFVVGELVQQVAGKVRALSAVRQPLCFAAGLDGAAFAPERLFDVRASLASRRFLVYAASAQNPAP